MLTIAGVSSRNKGYRKSDILALYVAQKNRVHIVHFVHHIYALIRDSWPINSVTIPELSQVCIIRIYSSLFFCDHEGKNNNAGETGCHQRF